MSDPAVQDLPEQSSTSMVLRGDDAAIQRMRAAEASGDFNVLAPSMRVTDLATAEDIRRLYIVGVSEVTIRLDPAYGELYHDSRYAKREEGKAALTARGLNKFASAAGVEWDIDRTGSVDITHKPNGHLAIHYRAVGRIRTAAGGWHEEVAERLLDTETIEEQLVAREQRKDSKLTEDQAKARTRMELLGIKERALERAETQAKNRVLRRLFNVPQVFTKDELSKPFMVPVLVYRPALEAGDAGRRAADAAFGPEPSEPTPEAGRTSEPGENPLPPPDESPSGSDEEADAVAAEDSDPGEDQAPEFIPGVDDESEDAELVVEDSNSGVDAAGETTAAAGGSVSAAPELEQPKDDPRVDAGSFEGYRFSALAVNPEGRKWLVEHEATTGPAFRRELARSWAAWGEAGS